MNLDSHVIVELSPNDRLATLLARLASEPASRLVFVAPPDFSLSPADLKVLAGRLAGLKRQAAFVTEDVPFRTVLDRAGFSTYRSVAAAGAGPWRRPQPRRMRLATPEGDAEALRPFPAGIFGPHTPSRFRAHNFMRAYVPRRTPVWTLLGMVVALIALWLLLILGLTVVVPAATVVVVPSHEQVQTTVSLRAIQDASVDVEAGIVPAKGLSVQVAGEGRMATTGRRDEPSAKGTGKATFKNRTAREITIPAGTIVATATGDNARFVTTTESKVPPSEQIQTAIEAMLPGPSGNVRAGTITRVDGPLSLSLVVTNEAPTTSGGNTQAAVVSEQDKEKLQAQLLEKLKGEAFDRLSERLEPGSFIAPESVTYLAVSPTFSSFVGDAAPELRLNMSVQAAALAVNARTGNESSLAELQRSMPTGARLVADSVRYIPGSVTLVSEQAATLNVTAVGTLLRGVDVAEVRSAVAGLSPDEAADLVQQRFGVERPRIALGPDWLPLVVPTRIPRLPWRIRVVLDWDAGAAAAR